MHSFEAEGREFESPRARHFISFQQLAQEAIICFFDRWPGRKTGGLLAISG